DPGAQAGMPAKGVNGAEDPQEHFLRQVQRFVVVVQQVEGELIDHPLMLADEFSAGVFVARGASLNERCLPASDVGPGNGSNGFHRQVTTHGSTAPLAYPFRSRVLSKVPRLLPWTS